MHRSIFIVVLLITQVLPFVLSEAYAAPLPPSRTINLVYDDSGSMLNAGTRQNPNCVDTWSQAKYALEIVTSMLDERDQLNIYYMSDYSYKNPAEDAKTPRLQIHGSRDAERVKNNVELVHSTITPFGATPFRAVEKAYRDLKQNSDPGSEKWLIVLTDGEFEDGAKPSNEVSAAFESYTSDGRIRVMMLSMGALAPSIASKEDKNIYTENAPTSKQIRSKLVSMTNRVFQRNALPQKNSADILFDIPMQQLIVFAQGPDVQINKLTTEGKTFAATSNVHPQYSTVASTGDSQCNSNYDKSLNGRIAVFDGEFAPGNYHIDVTGADAIEVYYKPNVDVKLILLDEVGRDVTDSAKLNQGEYSVQFGFSDPKTGEKLPDSELLGEAEFKASLVNNGVSKDVHSGDVIEIEEGTFSGGLSATYLKYNTASTEMAQKTVYFRNELVWEMGESVQYYVTRAGLTNCEGAPCPDSCACDGNDSIEGELKCKSPQVNAMTAHIKMRDKDTVKELTPEEWAALTVPVVSEIIPVTQDDEKVSKRRKKHQKDQEIRVNYRAEKSPTEPGTILIYPMVPSDKTMDLCSGKSYYLSRAFKSLRGVDLCANERFVYRGCTEFTIGDSSAYGCTPEQDLKVSNGISFGCWIKTFLINWWKFIILLIILLGYTPLFKKYMPAKIAKSPNIDMRPNGYQPGKKNTTTSGRYTRSKLNWLPYRTNTGEFNFKSCNIPVKKTLKLRATGGNSVILDNAAEYKGKSEITFNGGTKVPDNYNGKKPFKFSIGAPISVTGTEFIYTCMLNKPYGMKGKK